MTEIEREIGRRLLDSWDPHGIGGAGADHPRYADYVGGANRLIAGGASARDVAVFLCDAEAEALGFADSEPEMLVPLANRLLKLRRGPG